MAKTPLEDFTTEILAAILSSDTNLGDSFVNNVLKIAGKGFTFDTQVSYDLCDSNYPDCRVDMVIRSEDIICFVENKVEAREGYFQLERYTKVLNDLRKANNTTTHLQYCTKYYDEKTVNEHNFKQFRWADVYRFFLLHRSSGIINDYLDFLKNHNMSDELDLTLSDLMTLQGLNPAIKKMDGYLEKIRPIFIRYFNSSKIKDSSNLTQIKVHSRFIFHAANILGDNYSELGVGFDFNETPQLKVWIWITDKHNKKAEFKKALSDINFFNNGDSWVGKYAPISDFISSERMDEKIEKWFEDAFSEINQWKNRHPELDWHL